MRPRVPVRTPHALQCDDRLRFAHAAGLGAEVSKNIVLAGVGSLDVHDATLTTPLDLSSNFMLGESDLGIARGAHADERLAPLNPYVRVRSVDGPFSTAAELSGYTTVVAVDRPMEEVLRLNAACREAGCRLVVCDARGVFGRVFCDFGDAFTVEDTDGETPKTVRQTKPFAFAAQPQTQHANPLPSLSACARSPSRVSVRTRLTRARVCPGAARARLDGGGRRGGMRVGAAARS